MTKAPRLRRDEGPKRIENETATKFIYLLVCRICDDSAHTDELVFESPAARGQWATKHTRATGHDSWWVQDIPTNPVALARTLWRDRRHQQETSAQAARLVQVWADARAEVKRLRGLLARLEWAGRYWVGDENVPECPACGTGEGGAHTPDCWLAAELGREEA